MADAATRHKITKSNVAKIVPVLVRHDIIKAERGRRGGIRLARPASDITIGEIVRAIEVTRVAVDHLGGEANRKTPSATLINNMLGEAMTAFISVLDRHTVAEMVSAGYGIESLDPAISRTKEPSAHCAGGPPGPASDCPEGTSVSA